MVVCPGESAGEREMKLSAKSGESRLRKMVPAVTVIELTPRDTRVRVERGDHRCR
jgi:hypothetical protein